MPDQIRPGILTLLEAARENPDLYHLRYFDQTIRSLLDDFQIDDAKKDELWECLEGAALIFLRAENEGPLVSEVKSATEFAGKVKFHLDGLFSLAEVLEIFDDDGIHIGVRDRFLNLGIDDAVAFSHGLLHIIAPQLDGGFSKERLIALKRWRRENAQLIVRWSVALAVSAAQPIPQRPRVDKRLPQKIWVLCLMKFWVGALGRSAPLTKDVVKNSMPGAPTTQNISDFNAFCERCFSVLGDPTKLSLRTAIDAARRHFDREQEIRLALESGDFDRARELTRTWEDRIPVASGGKFVLDT